MTVFGDSTSRKELLLVFVLLSIVAYFVAPASFGDNKVLVPPHRELDAIQESLLIAGGIDKLLTNPASYYDTGILYPDHNQLRSTEPFLGFAILGLPLRTLRHLSDADVFEVLRMVIVFTSLAYAYLLYRALAIGIAISGRVNARETT